VKHRRVSLEIVGEIFLLAVVASLFAYFLVQSFRWPFGSALMPRIAVAIGIPFLIARVVILVRRTALEQGSIMDMGFRLGEDPESEKKNFVRICGFIVGLYLAIWVFGFHVALPLGMFLYLFFYGRAGWFVSTVVALSFLATIVGIYDNVLHISWHEPLIFRLLR
jgi:hypothetical protein